MHFLARGIFFGFYMSFPQTAANSGFREDLNNFTPDSVVSPSVAQAAVVQLPHGAVSSTHSPPPPRSVPPRAEELHAPVIHTIQSSRFDIYRDRYQGEGFFERAADFLAQKLQISTSLVYNRKWDTFCTWCTERQIYPISISIDMLGDFLIYLYEDQNLAASTLIVCNFARHIFTLAQLRMLNKLFFTGESRWNLLSFPCGILGSFYT